MEEVDSLGVGQLSNIQQNAALCSAIISKVHNGVVAVRNGANGCFATVLHPLSFAQKKKASEFAMLFFGGKRWIRLIAERASLLA